MDVLARLTVVLFSMALFVSACGPATPYPALDLPVRVQELDGDYLWPFGVHGGGHPEGHSGIDLFSTSQRDVIASADGMIVYRKPSSGGGEDLKIAVGGDLYVNIHHLTPTADMQSQTRVVRGQKIGVLTLISGRYMIHFDVNLGVSKPCPANFLRDSDLAALGESASDAGTIMALASYSEKTREPKLCNPF